MISLTLPEILLILGLAAVCAGFVALVLVTPLCASARWGGLLSTTSTGATFLFDDGDIIDASPDARSMIAGAPSNMTGRQAVERLLGKRFPNLGQEMDALLPDQASRLSPDDQSDDWIDLCKIAGHTRLTFCHPDCSGSVGSDIVSAITSELDFLRSVAEYSPQQIWQQDAKGNIVWANHAYLAMSDSVIGIPNSEGAAWPDRPLFENLHFDIPDTESVLRRCSVRIPTEKSETWFDVTSLRIDDTSLHFAVNANSAVVVEQSRKTLLQTFGRTFASLSTGLAIFNNKRQLSIFNPALMDLTGMSVEFLSGRPTIDMFLDGLREEQMLPEPKNYASWRDQFSALEDAALRGIYCENWALPDGLTYRVTGKPQGNGAFAFFFEDISAEISLTRRFRSEIETGQSVIDTLPDAIAVFSGTGTLVMSNAAYDSLWDVHGFGLMGRQDIRAEVAAWQKKCVSSPTWAELGDFICAVGDRTEWAETAILDDGRQVTCTAKPILGGKTLVSFTFPKKASPRIQMLTRKDPALLVGKR